MLNHTLSSSKNACGITSEIIENLENTTSGTNKEIEVKIRGFEKKTLQIFADLGIHFGIN